MGFNFYGIAVSRYRYRTYLYRQCRNLFFEQIRTFSEVPGRKLGKFGLTRPNDFSEMSPEKFP
jgi:hypothetical protein